MSEHSFRRRTMLGIAATLPMLVTRGAVARGRATVGGKITFRLPWPAGAIDPHRIDDPMAAIFGDALFDTLYARDESGAFSAQLAEADPEPEGSTLRVKLRAGIRTAKGRPLEPRDAIAS